MREAKFTKSLTVALPIDDYQKIKEITDNEKISMAQRTFSTQITLFSSIYLHYFQDRNYLDQLLSSPRFNKGIRVNL